MDTEQVRAGIDDTPFPSARYAWYVLFVFFLCGALAYTDRFVFNVLVDPLRSDLKLSDTGVSLIQGAAFALIYGILGLPIGRFADRTNRRNLIIAGVLIWSIATAACGLAQSFWQLFGARMFVGIGEATLAPSVMSLIPDIFPSGRRGTAISVFLMGGSAGAGLSYILSGVLLDAFGRGVLRNLPILGHIAPWRDVLIVLGLAGIVFGILSMTVREPERRGHGMSETLTARNFGHFIDYFKLNLATFSFIIIAHALVTMCDYAQSAWVPSVMMRNLHLSAASVGEYIGTLGTAASVLGTVLGGIVSDLLLRKGFATGRIWVMLVFYAIVVPSLFFPLFHSLGILLAIDFVCSVAIGAGGTAGIAAVQDAAPNDMRGILVSIQALMYTTVGLGVGPTAVALVTDKIFRDPSFVGLSVVAVTVPIATVAVILCWAAIKPYRITRAKFAADGLS